LITKRKKALDIPLINVDEATPQMGTGDLLMHHGTRATSEVMEFTMWCYFSHAVFVMRDPPADVLQLYGVTTESADGLYAYESTADVHGNQITALADWITINKQENGDEYILVWRKVEVSDPDCAGPERPFSCFPGLEDMIHEAHGRPYETHKMEMVKSLVNANKKEDLSSLFCSEMVMWAYKAMNLVPSDINASNWPTNRLSYYFGNSEWSKNDELSAEFDKVGFAIIQPEKRLGI